LFSALRLAYKTHKTINPDNMSIEEDY